MKTNNICHKGFIVTYVLVFGAIFLMMAGGILGFILIQLRQAGQRLAWNESLNIAEAGIDYYRWCLIHNIAAVCTGEHIYYDNSGSPVGKFSIDSSATVQCGQTVRHEIQSTGWTDRYPGIARKIRVLYARESVAKYSYVLNNNVWIGNDHDINGPYHNNGGIRMDGANQSLISGSALRNGLAEWVCTSSFGCGAGNCPAACHIHGTECVCPGVFTTTGNANTGLFDFPVPPFDFNAITIDLANIKNKAQERGIYLPKSSAINANGKGYHLRFQNDGTVKIFVVTAVSTTDGQSVEHGEQADPFTITDEYLYQTLPVPSECSVLFAEDTVWPDGVVEGKVTVASANLVDLDIDTSIILNGSIVYNSNDGSDGLALIAEDNALVGPSSPDNMELHSIIIAQKGHFGRNHYVGNFRNSLNIYGSVISNERVGTQWVNIGSGVIVSGYTHRTTYYDPKMVYSPPPFVANISPQFKVVSWEEIK